MIPDDKLIAWLVIIENQYRNDATVWIPHDVIAQLNARGWGRESEDKDWKGAFDFELLPAGQAIIDLHAPDYGIETIPA